MITIFDFQLMDLNERAEAIWKGVFISNRMAGDFTIQLFQIDSFNIEVFYNRELVEITKIGAFKALRLLERYLVGMQILFLS